MIVRIVLLFICSIFAYQAQGSELKKVASDYFTTYQKRSDFKKFMSFYAHDAQLDDLVYGHLAQNKKQIAAFFDWNRDDVEVLDGKKTFTIEHQVINKQLVITKGLFNRFKYNGKVMGPWRFVMWHKFDDNNKIIYQEDWINYTPKKDFLVGENRNPQ